MISTSVGARPIEGRPAAVVVARRRLCCASCGRVLRLGWWVAVHVGRGDDKARTAAIGCSTAYSAFFSDVDHRRRV